MVFLCSAADQFFPYVYPGRRGRMLKHFWMMIIVIKKALCLSIYDSTGLFCYKKNQFSSISSNSFGGSFLEESATYFFRALDALLYGAFVPAPPMQPPGQAYFVNIFLGKSLLSPHQ